jgi:hypothetical protein
MNHRHHANNEMIRRSVRIRMFGSILSASIVVAGCAHRNDPAMSDGADTDAGSQGSGAVAGVDRPPLPASHPQPDAPRAPKDRPREPGVAEARAKVIRRDADAIRAECRQAADGDWARWQRATAPYRSDLRAKVDKLKPPGPKPAAFLVGVLEALEGRDGFPLFEVAPRQWVPYLYDPESVDSFRRDRIVVAAHRWLRDRGIDLIFVPAPKMTEIYVEHFLEPCPPDGIIAPHMRHTILELLEDDLEVVDGFPLLRAIRDSHPEYLYNAADSHWGPGAVGPLAEEVAKRIARYQFGAEARLAPPIVKATPGPFYLHGPDNKEATVQNGWLALNEEQKRRAIAAQPKTNVNVTMPNGRVPPDDPHSPVLLTGNSFTVNFREQLIKDINLLIRTSASGGRTTESFEDFLREPELLDGCRVVVWVTSWQFITEFKPLPPEIAESAYRE